MQMVRGDIGDMDGERGRGGMWTVRGCEWVGTVRGMWAIVDSERTRSLWPGGWGTEMCTAYSCPGGWSWRDMVQAGERHCPLRARIPAATEKRPRPRGSTQETGL